MNLLTLDIETSPILADVWGLWQQNVGLSQIRVPTRMICFAAKWYGEKRVMFLSEHTEGRDAMIEAAWNLLDRADAVIHYNGSRFDIPHMKREFLEAGLTPPSPFKQIDLCSVAKKGFAFPSNKLDYVSQAVGLSGKLKHSGHKLWQDCLAGDERAWRLMKKYNVQDVRLTEELYVKLRPWIASHPNVNLYVEDGEVATPDACRTCGSANLERRGFKPLQMRLYQQYRCLDCGSWMRGNRAVDSVALSGA